MKKPTVRINDDGSITLVLPSGLEVTTPDIALEEVEALTQNQRDAIEYEMDEEAW